MARRQPTSSNSSSSKNNNKNNSYHLHTNKVFRANLDDVENLSYGRGAKRQRGTGSRFTCHRLNRDERRVYELAKRDGYLAVRGTGYRKERKGSPLWNTFRQRCDALGTICVVVEKRSSSSSSSGGGGDRLVIDLSTLRVPNDAAIVSCLLEDVFGKRDGLCEALRSAATRGRNDRGNDDDAPTLCSGTGAASRRACGTSTSASASTGALAAAAAENTTNRPVRWEAAKTRAIWGVEERLLAVSCDRAAARSIAADAVRAGSSARFARARAESDTPSERDAAGARDAARSEAAAAPTPTTRTRTRTRIPSTGGTAASGETIAARDTANSTNRDDDDTDDCIDWDDI